jgi:hypothetical protein
MSEPENVIARWSRRKREAAEGVEAVTPDPPCDLGGPARAGDEERNANDAPAAQGAASEPSTSALDWTKLPPIETITAESDIRAFLAPGVPAELTRAALRRVWAADPKIRDFIGLADYDWDFHTPGAIPGFGPLEMTEELRRQVVQMIESSLTEDGLDNPSPTPAEAQRARSSIERPTELTDTTPATPTDGIQSKGGTSQRESAGSTSEAHNCCPVLQCTQENIAAQNNPELPDNSQPLDRRPHGGALPK